MKTNDDEKGRELKPEYYGAFTKYFVKYIEGMRAEGITIDAITVENEPLNPKNTPRGSDTRPYPWLSRFDHYGQGRG